MTAKERYWSLRNAGLCVCCGEPATKSRCPGCMKVLTAAVSKSAKLRIERLKNRVAELEGNA